MSLSDDKQADVIDALSISNDIVSTNINETRDDLDFVVVKCPF